MGVRYRARQFLKALAARVTPTERERMRQILPPAACQLFESLPLQDQRHGIDVLEAIGASGEKDRNVWVAALLHDAGKHDSGLTIFHRVIIVLLRASKPAWLDRLAEPENTRWRKPFWVQKYHPEIGANLAQAAGCSEMAVWLIRNHHADPATLGNHQGRALLEALQRSDESN